MPAEVGTAFVSLIPSARGFASRMQSELNPAVAAGGRSFGKLGGMLGTAVVGGAAAGAAALGGLAAVGVGGASGLQGQLREVNTLLGATGAAGDRSLKALQDETRALSDELGISQSELADGLYQALSAGVPRDNVFEFLATSAKAGIGGVADTATAVDGISTIVNAFGRDASEAGTVADSMFAAVRGGKTTFGELSSAMSTVAPAAAAAGVSFQEVNAGIATLTAGGATTSQASTQLRAALVGLQRPSEEMTSIFQAAGYESAQAAIESEGLGAALGIVADAADGDNGKLTQLLGSVEAVGAAQVLAGTGAEKFAAEMAAQDEAAGGAAAAFDEVSQSSGRAWTEFTTQLNNVAIAIGQQLLPPLTDLLGKVSENLFPLLEQAAAYVQPAIEWFGTLGERFAGLAGQGDGLGLKLGELGEKFSGVFTAAQELVSAAVAFITDVWDRFGTHLVEFASRQFGRLQQMIGGALDVVTGIFSAFAAILRGDWSGLWDAVKQVVSGAWSFITGLVSAAWDGLKTLFGLGVATISAVWARLWETVKGALSSAWAAIKRAVSAGVDAVVGWFTALPGRVLSAISSLASDLFAKGREFLDRLRGGVEIAAIALQSWFTSLPGKVLGWLGNVGSRLYQAGRDLIQGLVNGITSMVTEAGRAAARAARGAIDAAKSALGLASPSKVFADIGRQTVAGFVVGVDQRAADAEAAVRRMLVVPDAPQVSTGGDELAAFDAAGGRGPLVNIERVDVADGVDAEMVGREIAYAAAARAA